MDWTMDWTVGTRFWADAQFNDDHFQETTGIRYTAVANHGYTIASGSIASYE